MNGRRLYEIAAFGGKTEHQVAEMVANDTLDQHNAQVDLETPVRVALWVIGSFVVAGLAWITDYGRWFL